MKKTSMKAKSEKAISTKLVLKTVLPSLAFGLCAGIVAGPHLPPEVAQWALTVLETLVNAVIKHMVGKMIA
ncbi:MAG TPA: hypothetical protein VFY83_13870 [Anaerolineales bacterium]|nr:hypothetical protein [Anaerolineales bacterium]